jgi:homoserine kinase type II
MSVYTKVSRAALQEFLQAYPVGELRNYQGIKAGIENTNYFVNTRDGHWVLTLFERASEADLPYFLALMDHLALRGIPSPRPVANADGQFLSHLCGRPTALVQKLEGDTITHPDVEQCRALGKVLGDLHLAGQSFRMRRDNDRGPPWWSRCAEALWPRINADDTALLRDEIAQQAKLDRGKLLQGVIHADLFRDNALFTGGQLTGLIDFYYACNDAQAYDVAVCVNDWCSREDGSIDMTRYDAMVGAYAKERNFMRSEKSAWGMLLRGAALRFWVSRLYDAHFPRDGELTHMKDPEEFRRILVHHRAHVPALP